MRIDEYTLDPPPKWSLNAFKGWLVHGESPLSLLYRETEGRIKKKKYTMSFIIQQIFYFPKRNKEANRRKLVVLIKLTKLAVSDIS